MSESIFRTSIAPDNQGTETRCNGGASPDIGVMTDFCALSVLEQMYFYSALDLKRAHFKFGAE